MCISTEFQKKISKADLTVEDIGKIASEITSRKLLKTVKTHQVFKDVVFNYLKSLGFTDYIYPKELIKHSQGIATICEYTTPWGTRSDDDFNIRLHNKSYRVRLHFQNSQGSAQLKLGNELQFCADTLKPELIVVCDGNGVLNSNYIRFLKTKAPRMDNVKGLFNIEEFKQLIIRLIRQQ